MRTEQHKDREIFNPHTLPLRLRDMYERRVLYVEEIISDMRAVSDGRVTESFFEGVRARHIAHAQETIREVAEYARASELLNRRMETEGYADAVRYPDLPSLG